MSEEMKKKLLELIEEYRDKAQVMYASYAEGLRRAITEIGKEATYDAERGNIKALADIWKNHEPGSDEQIRDYAVRGADIRPKKARLSDKDLLAGREIS